jgi:hypothetical protein
MTPSEALAFIETLPPDKREPARRAFEGIWDDGFLTGAAKLPRRNAFQAAPSPATEERKRR